MFVAAFDDRPITPDYIFPFIHNTTAFCDLNFLTPVKDLAASAKLDLGQSKYKLLTIDPATLPQYNHAKQLFDDLFNTKITSAPYITQSETPDPCNNLMYNKDRTNKLCFKYTIDNQYYTPNNYYAYYKKPILNEKNIKMARDLIHPEAYKRKLTDTTKATGLKYYEQLLKIDNSNFEDSGPLVNSFKTYICGPTTNNETLLDIQITSLRQEYEKFYSSLDAIKTDLSSISYLNSFDDETLKALNLNIANKTQELKSILGSGGANNGKLDDTTLLTQFKIVENSILLLLIVSVIFFFTKNKKPIVATGTLV
jgi:hypothetical protein